MTPDPKIDGIPGKVFGVPSEPIILGFVIAASMAFLGTLLPISTWFPTIKGKWVGGAWAVIAVAISLAAAMTKGIARTVIAGVAIGAWAVAIMKLMGWTPSV